MFGHGVHMFFVPFQLPPPPQKNKRHALVQRTQGPPLYSEKPGQRVIIALSGLVALFGFLSWSGMVVLDLELI